MRILPINITSPMLAKNNKKNNNFSVNNYMQKDVISFSGKNVAQSLLDSHLDILKRMKEMTIIKNSAKSQIIESTNKLLENINSKIKPLLNDDDFLWIITPEREKNKFSASIVSYSIQNPRDNSEIMSLITSQIQKRILEGDSEILLNELKNAGQKITKPEQQKKLQQLKTYISKKLEIINSKEEKINMIEIEDLNNEERNHLEKVLNKIIGMKKNNYPIMNTLSGLRALKNSQNAKYCWITNFIMPDGLRLTKCQGNEHGLCDVCGLGMAAEMKNLYNFNLETIMAGIRLRLFQNR